MSKKAIGIQMFHYAPVTLGETVTFGTPKRITDLESLDIANTFASGKNYADNVCNIDISQLTGATITAEFSHVAREVEAELGGRTYKSGAMVAKSDDVQKAVAIMYEKVYDDGSTERICYYNCKLTRNGNGGQTKTENITFEGVTLNGSAIPLPTGEVMLAIASDEMKEDATTKALFDDFFTTVPVVTA
ncbi:MAG: major tail protein [Cetobacterium sp.]